MSNDSAKRLAAEHALTLVESGMRLGLGTGSTARHFVDLLAQRLQAGELRDIVGVPTSEATAQQARSLGVPLTTLGELSQQQRAPLLDLAVDGADEVDVQLNLIKGLGKALLREKLVEVNAARLVIIADESKLVERLGQGPLPVEVTPFEAQWTVQWIGSLGCRAELWRDEAGELYVTDNGNYLARCWFEDGIPDAYALAYALSQRPGVVEHGLFLDMAHQVIVAGLDGVRVMERVA